MTKSKILAIQPNGTYQSANGLFYKFEYTFEDGKNVGAMHKTQNSPFQIGDEVEYEIKGSNDYGSYGKVSKPQEHYSGNRGGYSKPSKGGSNSSFALSYAKDLAGFYIAQGQQPTATDILEDAKVFLDWLNAN